MTPSLKYCIHLGYLDHFPLCLVEISYSRVIQLLSAKKCKQWTNRGCDWRWNSAEHDMRGRDASMHGRAGLMDTGHQGLAEGHWQAGWRDQTGGEHHFQLQLILLCVTRFLFKDGSLRGGRRGKRRQKGWLAGMFDYKVSERKQIVPVAGRRYSERMQK